MKNIHVFFCWIKRTCRTVWFYAEPCRAQKHVQEDKKNMRPTELSGWGGGVFSVSFHWVLCLNKVWQGLISLVENIGRRAGRGETAKGGESASSRSQAYRVVPTGWNVQWEVRDFHLRSFLSPQSHQMVGLAFARLLLYFLSPPFAVPCGFFSPCQSGL
jgi:hypothetical protein